MKCCQWLIPFSLGIATQQAKKIVAGTFVLWGKCFSRKGNQDGDTPEVFEEKNGSATVIKSQDGEVSAQISDLKAANEAMRKDIEKLKLDAMQCHEMKSKLGNIEIKFNEVVSFK